MVVFEAKLPQNIREICVRNRETGIEHQLHLSSEYKVSSSFPMGRKYSRNQQCWYQRWDCRIINELQGNRNGKRAK